MNSLESRVKCERSSGYQAGAGTMTISYEVGETRGKAKHTSPSLPFLRMWLFLICIRFRIVLRTRHDG